MVGFMLCKFVTVPAGAICHGTSDAETPQPSTRSGWNPHLCRLGSKNALLVAIIKKVTSSSIQNGSWLQTWLTNSCQIPIFLHSPCSYCCLAGNGWEWGLLGWLLLVLTGIIPSNSLRLAPVSIFCIRHFFHPNPMPWGSSQGRCDTSETGSKGRLWLWLSLAASSVWKTMKKWNCSSNINGFWWILMDLFMDVNGFWWILIDFNGF